MPRQPVAQFRSPVRISRREGRPRLFRKHRRLDGAHRVHICPFNLCPSASAPLASAKATLRPAPSRAMRYCVIVRRSEEHTSELQSLMRISYAVTCLQKKKHLTRLAYSTNTTTAHT